MAMDWNSLVAPKGTTGSIANFTAYTKLDIGVIVDEAQTLLWEFLRCREMRTEFRFTMLVGMSEIALPARFLDPIGRILSTSQNWDFIHKDEGFVQQRRVYQETSGTLGTNPFTTTNGSALVAVHLTAHGFNQGSTFFAAAATAVGGLTPNGTFPLASVTDADNFVIDCSSLGKATSGATGGGSAATYVCQNLVQSAPRFWSIWDEAIKFDAAFNQQQTLSLLHFASPQLLSALNPTSFLTSRYPHLMRKAAQVQAADFMQDTEEFNKGVAQLVALVQRTQVQDDLSYRGMELLMEVPGGR